jgi:hypothetical protein
MSQDQLTAPENASKGMGVRQLMFSLGRIADMTDEDPALKVLIIPDEISQLTVICLDGFLEYLAGPTLIAGDAPTVGIRGTAVAEAPEGKGSRNWVFEIQS